MFDAVVTGNTGCILAHCMGLGKSLQVIALIDALLRDGQQKEMEAREKRGENINRDDVWSDDGSDAEPAAQEIPLVKESSSSSSYSSSSSSYSSAADAIDLTTDALEPGPAASSSLKSVKTVLVLAPKNVTHNWRDEVGCISPTPSLHLQLWQFSFTRQHVHFFTCQQESRVLVITG